MHGRYAFLALVLVLPVVAADPTPPAHPAPERDPDPAAIVQAPTTQRDQRLELEAALAELDAASPGPAERDHLRGALLFRLGRYDEAAKAYDAAAVVGRPHDADSCWERGLAWYYAGDYRAAAAQFARYHRVGPTDVENGLWYFLCIAEEEGIEKARETMFAYPRMRPAPFPALLALYLGNGTVDAVFAEANRGNVAESERTEHLFFAHYYVAKFHELEGNREAARTHLEQALKHEFRHFMYACAEADAVRIASP